MFNKMPQYLLIKYFTGSMCELFAPVQMEII